jgi:hypothetical protein
MRNLANLHLKRIGSETVSMMRRVGNGAVLATAGLLAAPALHAQTNEGATTRAEFPSDAQTLTAQALKDRLEGHAFKANLQDGSSWRLQFKSKYIYVNISSGANDSGTWRTEDGKLCVEYQRFPSGCSEMRGSAKDLYFKRASTGEVVLFEIND